MQNNALVASLLQRHVERAQHQFGVQVVRHRPADDAPAEDIKLPGVKQDESRIDSGFMLPNRGRCLM